MAETYGVIWPREPGPEPVSGLIPPLRVVPEPTRGGTFLRCPEEACKSRHRTVKAYRRHWAREHDAPLAGFYDEAERFRCHMPELGEEPSAEPGRSLEAAGTLAPVPAAEPFRAVAGDEGKAEALRADVNDRLRERRSLEAERRSWLSRRLTRDPASAFRRRSS
jgi:hypothetical protein